MCDAERRQRPEPHVPAIVAGLFVYAKKKSFKRDVVAAYIRHMIVNEKAIATRHASFR